MKKRSILYYILLVTAISACEPQAGKEDRSVNLNARRNITSKTDVDGDAAAFMKDAALLVRVQMDLASAVLSNSQSPKLKDYARAAIQDYSRVLSELERVATRGGLLLPGQLPFDINEKIAVFKTLKGPAFDKEYIRQLNDGNPKMIAAFESGIRVITDDVSRFAARALPIIKKHSQTISTYRL